MKNIFSIGLLIVLGIVLTSTESYSQQKNWTFLVYLVGSDLESGSGAGTSDIFEIIEAGATDNVNVVVLTGGANKDGWRTPSAQLYNNGEEIALDFDAGGKQMSSSENVTAFIDWALTNYPADKVALTFWNHGSDIRGYGNDEVSGSNLSVPKVREALENTSFIQNNNKFELLGFDACLMGNLETVSTLQNFSNWYIGSEEQEPGHGWNYTPIVESLNLADNSFGGNDLGEVIVDGFVSQSQSESTTAITLGVVNTSKINALENSLVALFQALLDQGKVKELHKARARAEEYSKSIQNPEYSEDMVDIGDLMEKLLTFTPELSTEINNVTLNLDEAIYYSRNDMARPNSTGLSMYIPHNVLVDEDELYSILNNHYYPIDFSQEIRDFIYDEYTWQALSDNNPPSGTIDPDFTFHQKNSDGSVSHRQAELVSALTVEHNDDLEQVQVLLIEELEGFPNEYIFLGSTHIDTIAIGENGIDTYAYHWDDYWIGINGHPAYISDIYDFVHDDDGVLTNYTRVQIPIVKNLEQEDEEFLIVSYRFDDEYYVLESIIPEPYTSENGDMIVPKKRVFLEPGDKVQLLYEGFNEVTDEEFFVVDDNAIITIENGNEDLMLEDDELEVGNYQIAFLLEDHSQNDTLIFDPAIYSITYTGIESISNDNHFDLYPNPTTNHFSINLNELNMANVEMKVIDIMGRIMHTQTISNKTTTFDLNLPNGVYTIELTSDNSRITDRLIIQK